MTRNKCTEPEYLEISENKTLRELKYEISYDTANRILGIDIKTYKASTKLRELRTLAKDKTHM